MATVTAYRAMDRDVQSLAWNLDGDITIRNSSHIQAQSYDSRYVVNLYGSFKYSGSYLSGGTLSSMNVFEFGDKIFELTGAKYNVATIADYVEFGDTTGLTSYFFGGNDQFNGSSENDWLEAFGGNDKIYGNAGDDDLFGSDGDDLLHGGTGADDMWGGDGSDTYYVDNIWDFVIEFNLSAGGSGTDIVLSSLTSYFLPDYVENGRILNTGTASLTGNNLGRACPEFCV